MSKQDVLARWSVNDSANLYGIKDWGAGYFDLSPKGELVVRVPFANKTVDVSLMSILDGVRERGLEMPVLLRIENLLDAQISKLNESFRKAIAKFEYRGAYQGVFPIKVNQQAQVIEEIAQFGKRYNHGLEAGSKAELMIALSMLQSRESLLVCNGYKDEEFIDLGLLAVKMGHKCFFVLETPAELPIILKRSEELGVRPMIGVRIKLSSHGGGHWQDSGDNSLFGLTTNQIVDVIDELKRHDMLDCLQLLHHHLGSQIPNIRDIRAAVRETARFYSNLVKEGAKMGYIDLGGGLAVDYDGSQTNYVHSKNYTLDEYCADVIEGIMETLADDGIAHPTIITESGRATVAYSSILLFNILDVNSFEAGEIPESVPDDAPEPLRNLWETRRNLNLKHIQECYNDAVYYREELCEMFKHGDASLRDRALSDKIFIDVVRNVAASLDKMKRIPPELEGLQDALYDIYYGNFSLFQSLPDSWAIDQIFPVMPIHRLTEEPTRRAIIADITCDSDGKIDRFADLHDVRKALPVHDLKENEEYYLAIFLVGAYQETLGDLHNLLGDTNVVSVRINEDGSFDFVREIEGDSVWDVLSYVEYEPKSLVERFRDKAEQAVREQRITVGDRRKILAVYESSIRGYTYFEK